MKYILLTLIIIYNISLAKSQDSDTLTLSETIERVLETYPSILQADDEIKISEVNLKLAKDNYLPSLSGKASYLWMDPISSLDMNDKTIHIQAHNNTSIGITLSQLIWDFGKTRPKIEAARLQKQISELQKEQLMQNLSLQAIQSYYMTGYTRHSITVKEKQLEDYGKLLIQTEVKKNTGAATNFDYLNTNAEFNAVKTELIALNTAKEKQYVSLSILTDTIINDRTLLSLSFKRQNEEISLDQLINMALESRIEMRIMTNELKLAQEQLKSDERIFNPTLNADVSAGVKNGYEPNIKDIRLNYSAGATLNVPIYEKGKRSKHKSLGKLEVNKAINTIELTKKEISSQVADSYLTLVSSFAKIEQLKVQANVSEQAYQQALVNYATGAITNLELLTSSTNATNSKLLLLQEEITYQIAYYRLLMDIGVKIY